MFVGKPDFLLDAVQKLAEPGRKLSRWNGPRSSSPRSAATDPSETFVAQPGLRQFPVYNDR